MYTFMQKKIKFLKTIFTLQKKYIIIIIPYLYYHIHLFFLYLYKYTKLNTNKYFPNVFVQVNNKKLTKIIRFYFRMFPGFFL